MKTALLLPLLSLLLVLSCKKHHDVNTPTPKPDTLGTGWTKIETGAKGYISDIFFIGNTGFCIADNNIYKSTNGGDNWIKLIETNPVAAQRFENLGMGSADNAGFVCGNFGQYIYSTKNGGASFDSTKMTEYNFFDIFYVSPLVAYAINGKLWKSTDGGKSWNSIYSFPGSNSTYETLYFVNEQVGWARSHNTLFKTVNGGVDWTPISNHGLSDSPFGTVFFVDQNTGFYSNDKIIKKTTDGGANWSTVYTSTLPKTYHDIHFITPQTGYITDNQLILKTTDGGATWTKVVAMGEKTFVELHFTDANHGWAGSDKGIVLKFVN